MMLKTLASLALLAALAGCAGTGVNSAPLYKPTQGTIALAVDTQEPGVQSVSFEVDNEPVGEDTDGSDGWTYQLDTTTYTDGIHYVKAWGVLGDGSRLLLLDNTILIDNGGTIGTGTGTGGDTTGGDAGAQLPADGGATGDDTEF